MTEREYAEWLEAWKIRIFGSIAAYNFSKPMTEWVKTGEVDARGRDMWAGVTPSMKNRA